MSISWFLIAHFPVLLLQFNPSAVTGHHSIALQGFVNKDITPIDFIPLNSHREEINHGIKSKSDSD
jgi:hypothetical protein